MTITRRDCIGRALALSALPLLGPLRAFAGESDPLVTSADQAVDVFDFERLARSKLPPAHFGYLATGVDGDATLHANTAGFEHYSLRVRRLIGVNKVDMSMNLFGTTWETPIVIDPVGSQRAFSPEGEIGTAKAAASRKTLQVLSTVSSRASRTSTPRAASRSGTSFTRPTSGTSRRRSSSERATPDARHWR
jgi:hypothetical protein